MENFAAATGTYCLRVFSLPFWNEIKYFHGSCHNWGPETLIFVKKKKKRYFCCSHCAVCFSRRQKVLNILNTFVLNGNTSTGNYLYLVALFTVFDDYQSEKMKIVDTIPGFRFSTNVHTGKVRVKKTKQYIGRERGKTKNYGTKTPASHSTS